MTRAALLLCLLAAPAAAEVAFTDALGREVTLPAPPERVVALYNDAYGHMASLGVRPVATLVNPEMQADHAYYFEDGESIPLVGAMDGSPDAELVASHDPDLILAWNAEDAAQFAGIAPVLSLEPFDGVEGPKTALREIARILGREAVAEERIAAFEARVGAYAARVPDRPTVLKLGAEGADSFWIGSAGDPACALLDRVVTCEWADQEGEGWSYQATTEAVLEMDPDVIVLGNWTEMGDAALRAALEANPLWGEVRAVREGRVISIPGYQNPIYSSVAAGEKLLDTLIPAIFPEAFPDGPLTDEEVAGEMTQ